MNKKNLFLLIFIIGIIWILNIPIEAIDGLDLSIGQRLASPLLALFGLVGYFIEVVLENLAYLKFIVIIYLLTFI